MRGQRTHRQLHPRLVEYALLQAQLSYERWKVASWTAPLRLELLHARYKTCLTMQCPIKHQAGIM